MKEWAIGYHSPNCYILRGDITEVFTDYAKLVRYMKDQEGEHQVYDLTTDGVIELLHGIVTMLDSRDAKFDAWLKEQWNVVV